MLEMFMDDCSCGANSPDWGIIVFALVLYVLYAFAISTIKVKPENKGK